MKLKKTAFSAALAFSTALCLAQTAVPAALAPQGGKPAPGPRREKPTKEQIIERQKAFYAKTGGFVPLPTEGAAVYYLNGQTLFSEETLRKGIEGIHGVTQFLSKTEKLDAAADPFSAAAKAVARPTNDVAFAILLVESDKLPTLLVAPENRWGILNVSNLKGEPAAAPEVLEKRFSRELWRVTTWVLGGGISQMRSAMSPVFSNADLDDAGDVTSPDELGTVLNLGRERGVATRKMATYRKAAEMGLAPEPKDEIQAAILAEVKAAAATNAAVPAAAAPAPDAK